MASLLRTGWQPEEPASRKGSGSAKAAQRSRLPSIEGTTPRAAERAISAVVRHEPSAAADLSARQAAIELDTSINSLPWDEAAELRRLLLATCCSGKQYVSTSVGTLQQAPVPGGGGGV